MDYIPTKDGDLAVFTLNFVKYGEDNAARLKFDTGELAELRRLGEDFEEKRKNTLKPGHSALDVAAKNASLHGRIFSSLCCWAIPDNTSCTHEAHR